MRKRITVVFGGTFDPFTGAHRRIVEKLQDKFIDEIKKNDVDFQIIIAPSIVNWHRKDKEPFLTYSERLAVIWQTLDKVKIDGYNYFNVWMGEWDRAAMLKGNPLKDEILGQRGFVDTLEDIMANYTSFQEVEDGKSCHEWYFVIGSDQLEMFKKWKKWQSVLSLAKMIVVNGRNGKVFNDYKEEFGYDEIFLEPEYENESASKLRAEWRDKGFDAFYNYISKKYALDEKVYTRYESPIFDVTEGPEIAPGFAPVRVKAPNWASIIVEKSGKYLMVTQLRYGTNAMSTEFPCGMAEDGEPPIVAAYRELKEETGIKLKQYEDIKFLGSYSPNPAFMTNKMYYFYVNLDKCEYEQVSTELDKHEKITSSYVDKDEAAASIMADSNSSVIMITALALVQRMENT